MFLSFKNNNYNLKLKNNNINKYDKLFIWKKNWIRKNVYLNNRFLSIEKKKIMVKKLKRKPKLKLKLNLKIKSKKKLSLNLHRSYIKNKSFNYYTKTKNTGSYFVNNVKINNSYKPIIQFNNIINKNLKNKLEKRKMLLKNLNIDFLITKIIKLIDFYKIK